jgi:hypothetical protein
MSVSPTVSRAHVEEELEEVARWSERCGWLLDWQPEQLVLRVTMRSSIDDEQYVFEFLFEDYREIPPLIELLHPVTGERGTARCYPAGGRGYFHPNRLICAPWNQRAYAVHSGPHSDWEMKNWATYRPHHHRLGSILALLQDLLNDPSYTGRMEK